MSAYHEPDPSERRRPASLRPQGLKPVCVDCKRVLHPDEPRISRRGAWLCQECAYHEQMRRG